MAMLAEPKRFRKRYNIVPRGKALYEDENRFGTKMLEKMGWSKGKGLGAKETGDLDFVRVRYKNDEQGLGFEHRDDQWTQHEDSFQSLLKTLNGEENEEQKDTSKTSSEHNNDSEDDIPRVGFGFQDTSVKKETNKKSDKSLKLKERISGISLEEKSKQSRARVHYKKFTKGKDLSQYSEKDLANIFGKKPVDEQQQATNDFYQQLSNTFSKKSDEPEEDTKEKNEDTKDSLENGQTFISNVSVADYFKMKMEAIKNRKNGNNSEIKQEQETPTEVEENEVSQKKKKKKKVKKLKEEEIEKIVEVVEVITEEEIKKPEQTRQEKMESGQIFTSTMSVADYFKAKMEAMKNRRNANNNVEIQMEQDTAAEVQEDEISKKKKKKKKEKKEQDQEEEMEEEIIISEVEQPISKSKKSKNQVESNTVDENDIPAVTKKEKSKKKKTSEALETPPENIQSMKRKNDADIPVECTDQIDLTTEEEPQKKKKKKNKSNDACEVIEIEDDTTKETIPDQTTTTSTKEKKKKKKTKLESNESSEGNQNELTSQEIAVTEVQKPKKSKKKDVSSTPKRQTLTNDVTQALTLDDLNSKYKSLNIYQISSFCAEKFRNVNLNQFAGSTLPQVDGYAFNTDIQLDVQINKNDEERITNLWKSALDKYSELKKPKKTYRSYVQEVFKARKKKQKRPKLYVKTWKRKNAFQII